MQFGSAYAAPDYQTRAQAGMPLDPNAPDQSVMPSAPAAQQQLPTFKPSPFDILADVLINGKTPADAAMAARSRNYQQQTMQIMAQTLKDAPPDQRLAMLLNPTKLGEAVASRFQSMALKGGETRNNGEGGPASSTAPLMGFDEKSGRGYTSLPGLTVPNGPSLGGDISVSPTGAVVSGRTGLTGDTVSLPQLKPLGSSLESYTPAVTGGGGPSGQGGGGPAPATTGGMPRGIRNNNFGNVRPLPNGHAWPGQTGVDADGYAVFASPNDGVKAAAQNLQSYAKQGINTLSAIVNTWAPKGDGKNDPVAYAHYLAGKLGVDPNEKLDLSDKGVQQGLLRGIFDFENGPKAMASWRGPKAPGAQGGGATIQTLSPAAKPTLVPPDDPAHAAFPKGTTLQRAPTGELSVIQKPEYDPASKAALRDKAMGEEYKMAKASMAAYQAMTANANTMTGPSAYAMLDTFARAINPGAVARPTVIETIQRNLGLPAQLVGGLESKFGKGNLPPEVRQQIIDAVVPFAQAHWDQANLMNQANAALAHKHDFDPADVTGPLEARPRRLNMTVPAAEQRQSGALYMTPRGPMTWTGTGWRPAN